MVYDDYADIGIFAKWVMDAPGIGERAHPSEGRRCPCTRKGIKLVLLTIIAISQPLYFTAGVIFSAGAVPARSIISGAVRLAEP